MEIFGKIHGSKYKFRLIDKLNDLYLKKIGFIHLRLKQLLIESNINCLGYE